MSPGHINTRKIKNIYPSAMWKLTVYRKRSRMKNHITSVQHGSAKCSDSPTCWFWENSYKWGLNWVFREDWAAAKWNGIGKQQSCASSHYCSTKAMGAHGERGHPQLSLWEPLKGFQQESSQWDRGSAITWWPREGAFSRDRHCNSKEFLATGWQKVQTWPTITGTGRDEQDDLEAYFIR